MQKRVRPETDKKVIPLDQYRREKAIKEPLYPDVKEDVAYYLMMAIKALKNGRH